MVINPCANIGMPMSKNKDDLAQTKIHGKNIHVNVNIEAKSQGQGLHVQFVYNFA